MLARLRRWGDWVVTGLDDVFVERFRARLLRGQVAAALRVFPDVILGFWGCGAVLAALALLVALLVAAV